MQSRSASDCESDTQSNISSHFDQLNNARIQDDDSDLFTPIKKGTKIKKMQLSDTQSEDNSLKNTQYTKSIYNKTDRTITPQKMKQLKQKYTSKQCRTITVQTKKNESAKYADVCPICLSQYSKQTGSLNCNHKFCLDCITQWIKASTNCPCCRSKFNEILKISQNKRQLIKVQEKQMIFSELDYFTCYVCNMGDDEDVLLICDMCDFYCCHVYCDNRLNNIMPEGDWYCRNCQTSLQETQTTQNLANSRQSNLNQEQNQSRVRTRARTQRTITQPSRNARVNQVQSHQHPDHYYEDQQEQSENDQLNSQDSINLLSPIRSRQKHHFRITRASTRNLWENHHNRVLQRRSRNRLQNVIQNLIDNYRPGRNGRVNQIALRPRRL